MVVVWEITNIKRFAQIESVPTMVFAQIEFVPTIKMERN